MSLAVETVDPARIVAELRVRFAPASVFIHRDEEHFLYVNTAPSVAMMVEFCEQFGLVFVEPDALDWSDEACEACVTGIEGAAVSDCSLVELRIELSMSDLLFLRDCHRLKSNDVTPTDYDPLKRILKLLAMPDGMRHERMPAAVTRLRQDCAVAMRLNSTRIVKAAAMLLELRSV